MRDLRCLGLLALGAAASGCIVFDEPSEPGEPPVTSVDPRPADETARFRPLLCAGAPVGAATCPLNQLALDDLGAAGARFQFLVEAVGTGLYLSRFAIVAGPDGMYAERPMLRVFSSSMSSRSQDVVFDVVLNLRPAEAAQLRTASFASTALDSMSLRVPAIGPYRRE
jgi:hypothetical protein